MDNQFNASLWGDEGFSAILSRHSVPDIISIIIKDTSPPLYNLTEHFVFQVFGDSEVVIRGLSFFYYLVAVLFAALIAKHFWGKRAGYLTALLVFFNPFFFIYAFEGRMYSIMAAGIAASMYFFITRKWKFYVIATLWALYSHHFAIFSVLVQGVWFIYSLIKARYFLDGKKKITEDKSLLNNIKAFIFVGMGYLPWLYPLYLQTSKVGTGFWLTTPTTKEYFNLLFDYLGRGISHPLSSLALYLVLAALVLRKWDKDKEKGVFLLAWFLIPITATWIISQFFTSVFYNRYLIPSIPAAMILAASSWRPKVSIPLIISIIACFLIIDVHYFNNPTKEPFRQLANYVKETKNEDDILINWDAGRHKLWEARYYGIPAPIYNPGNQELPYFVGAALMTEDDFISQIPKTTDRVGVIQPSNPEDVKLEGYVKESEKQFGSIWLIWLKRSAEK